MLSAYSNKHQPLLSQYHAKYGKLRITYCSVHILAIIVSVYLYIQLPASITRSIDTAFLSCITFCPTTANCSHIHRSTRTDMPVYAYQEYASFAIMLVSLSATRDVIMHTLSTLTGCLDCSVPSRDQSLTSRSDRLSNLAVLAETAVYVSAPFRCLETKLSYCMNVPHVLHTVWRRLSIPSDVGRDVVVK